MRDPKEQRKPGNARSRRISESHKNQIAAGVIMQRLKDNAAGKLVDQNRNPYFMSASEIKAAEIFLSKTVPSLSAVEQTQVEEQATPEQLLAQLTAMLDDKATRDMLRNMLKGYPDASEDTNNIVPISKQA